MSSELPRNSFDIFYQNVRGLRTKQSEFHDKVSATDCNLISLTETWLNDLCLDHNLFSVIQFFDQIGKVPFRQVVMES
jgi:hypothetical protein